MKRKQVWFCAAAMALLAGVPFSRIGAQQVKRPFTVADDIGITLMDGSDDARFSPDGSYFTVAARRGRLDINNVEESLRFYDSREIKKFLESPEGTQPPAPVWVTTKTDSTGFDGWRWLEDSSAVLYKEHVAGKERLVFADPRKKRIEPLTPAVEGLKTFDFRDRQNYVYSVKDSGPVEKLHQESHAAAIDATGRSLYSLLFTNNPAIESLSSNRSHLWAVVGGKRFEVKHEGAPILYTEELALSPDATSVLTTLPVSEIPQSWETLYQPPYPSVTGVHAGKQNLELGVFSMRRYVRISLKTGAIEVLADSPLPWQASWGSSGYEPSWSKDGREILLSAVFPVSQGNTPVRPCVAVVSASSDDLHCVLAWQQIRKDLEGVWVRDAWFADGNPGRIIVKLIVVKNGARSVERQEYRRNGNGAWEAFGAAEPEADKEKEGLKVTVKQGFNDPPVLVASDGKVSRVIWDPNPELKNLDMGQASVYTWKDKEGKERRALLYKPSDYQPGRRYPLVMQTHGYSEMEFRPSGGLTTGYAARELAAAGIVVLQVEDVGDCGNGALDEGPCNAAGYETVAKQLVSEGIADPDKIGLAGFSATVYHVMQALTTRSSVHYKAALVTDGVMAGYFQYLINVDRAGFADEYDSQIGARPFSEGLQTWLKRSPTFNLEKVETPLMVVAEGGHDLLFMWEPYAGLRYLHKPVELVLLNTSEHALSNPAMRMASQGGAVDWFRFWLQGYEDRDPSKAEQYARWHELRDMQEKSRQGTSAGL